MICFFYTLVAAATDLEKFLRGAQEMMSALNTNSRYMTPTEPAAYVLPGEFSVQQSTLQVDSAKAYFDVALTPNTRLIAALNMLLTTKPDSNKYVFDCTLANALSMLNGFRHILGDKTFENCTKEFTVVFSPSQLETKTACGFFENQFCQPCRPPEIAILGYMEQSDPSLYQKKHKEGVCSAFNFLITENGLMAFNPSTAGRFKSLLELAKYMVAEMNADLSLEELKCVEREVVVFCEEKGWKTDESSPYFKRAFKTTVDNRNGIKVLGIKETYDQMCRNTRFYTFDFKKIHSHFSL